MRVTRPVRGRVVRRRPDVGGPWALHKLRRARGEPHNSRATSCEGMHPNLEGQDGAVAVSLAIRSASVGRCLGDSWSSLPTRFGASGYRCTTLQGENYTYSRVLGHVHSYSSVSSSRVENPNFYLPLVHFPLWSQMR